MQGICSLIQCDILKSVTVSSSIILILVAINQILESLQFQDIAWELKAKCHSLFHMCSYLFVALDIKVIFLNDRFFIFRGFFFKAL